MFTFFLNAIINVLEVLLPSYDLQPLLTAVATPLGYCKFLIGGFTFNFLIFVLNVWLILALVIFACRVIGQVVSRLTNFLS